MNAPVNKEHVGRQHCEKETVGVRVTKVSIGMPVYNGAMYIREALDSLVSQTFTDFELIISDNCSDDGTQEICEEYAENDGRVRYVRQSKNRGGYANFQFVLDEAVGEYFMWAAADDTQDSKFLANLVDILDNNQDLCCVMSDVKNIGEESEFLYTSSLDDIRIKDLRVNWPTVRKRFFRNPTSNIYFCIYGLIRVNVLRKVHHMMVSSLVVSSSEIPLLAQLSLLGKIGSVAKPLKGYRRHDKSIYHIEQESIKYLDRMIGFYTVTHALLRIITTSTLSIYEKLDLYFSAVSGAIRWPMGYIKYKILMLRKEMTRH